MRSPMALRIAGRRVRAAKSETITASTAPSAMLRKKSIGTMNIAIRARTTVMPLNSTARLAVAPAAVIAATVSSPRRRSSL